MMENNKFNYNFTMMKQWDKWLNARSNGDKGSWIRDEFENEISCIIETCCNIAEEMNNKEISEEIWKRYRESVRNV